MFARIVDPEPTAPSMRLGHPAPTCVPRGVSDVFDLCSTCLFHWLHQFAGTLPTSVRIVCAMAGSQWMFVCAHACNSDSTAPTQPPMRPPCSARRGLTAPLVRARVHPVQPTHPIRSRARPLCQLAQRAPRAVSAGSSAHRRVLTPLGRCGAMH